MFIISPYSFSSPYEANAVTFDGTNDYIRKTSALTVSDSETFTLSFWFRTSYTSADQTIIDIRGSGDGDGAARFLCLITTYGVELQAKNASGLTEISGTAPNKTFRDGNWHHVIISRDPAGTDTTYCYIDDVSAPGISDGGSGVIDFTRNRNTIGAQEDNGTKLNGDLADFYFDTSYIDLSVEANRRLFINADGTPASRSASGVIWLSGDTDDWHTNKGTGGGFTETGALTTSSNLPVEL